MTMTGRLFAESDDGRFVVEDADGGTLVWDRDCDGVGRELIGFGEVADREAMRQTLARRGLGVGALHQLEVVDVPEVPR